MLKKSRLLTRSTLARQDAPYPKQGAANYGLIRGRWDDPNCAHRTTLILRACFESIYLQRQIEREGSGALPNWLFCSEQGTPIDGHNLRSRWWKPLLEAAQLPPIRLHGLRGSVVSLLLNEGLTPWEVQSYIGHRSLVMTCNIYGHRILVLAASKRRCRSFSR